MAKVPERRDQWHFSLERELEGDKRGMGTRKINQAFRLAPLTYFAMPRDNASRYFIPGAFSSHTISQMSRMTHTRAANSTRMYPRPYPTAHSLIERIDEAGDGWYSDCADDLHLRNFIWFARMQTARRMSISGRQPRGGDQVLERLLEEGTFDRVEPNIPNAIEEFCMAHAAAIGQRLLVRIEGLERRVSQSLCYLAPCLTARSR